MSFSLDTVTISGVKVLPIFEGGKGIGVTNYNTSGNFADNDTVGTISVANAKCMDQNGNIIPIEYKGKTRIARHQELIEWSIRGGIEQAYRAYEVSNGHGVIHINVLWEMAGAEQVLHGIMEKCSHIIKGITSGAGMPYRLADIAAKYKVFYYPIVSSVKAFRILWLRSYKRLANFLGGVVYEDPWKAGGHNGISNQEDPLSPEDPYPRVASIRKFMNEVGLHHTPIIMAGGVWHLSEWEHWFNNSEIGPIAFQFGTRPVVTTESPVSEAWKKKLLTLKKGDVILNRFSPTGFYSSAVKNQFINELVQRFERQIPFSSDKTDDYSHELPIGARGRGVYITAQDHLQAAAWQQQGFDTILKTPDNTVIFVTSAESKKIREDQIACMGCLSRCKFSNWMQKEPYNTGKKPDPRSYCIQKTLQNIVDGESVEDNLLFSGHNGFRFVDDEFYQGGFIPTIKQLIDRISTGK